MSVRRKARHIADSCLVMRARRISRGLTRIYDEELRPHGLVAAQLNLLVALEAAGGARATDLGDALDIEKSTLSRTLARLEADGLVARDEARLYHLTDEGRDRLSDASAAWKRAQARAVEALGPALTRALSKIPA